MVCEANLRVETVSEQPRTQTERDHEHYADPVAVCSCPSLLQPVHEIPHMLSPKIGPRHGQVPRRRGRARLNDVTTLFQLRHKGLEDLEPIRIELVVREIQGEKLCLDLRQIGFWIVVER